MPLLYVIEDDGGIRHLLTIALENCGYTVKSFETAEEALLSMEQTPPDLCLFDIMLPLAWTAWRRCAGCAPHRG